MTPQYQRIRKKNYNCNKNNNVMHADCPSSLYEKCLRTLKSLEDDAECNKSRFSIFENKTNEIEALTDTKQHCIKYEM